MMLVCVLFNFVGRFGLGLSNILVLDRDRLIRLFEVVILILIFGCRVCSGFRYFGSSRYVIVLVVVMWNVFFIFWEVIVRLCDICVEV